MVRPSASVTVPSGARYRAVTACRAGSPARALGAVPPPAPGLSRAAFVVTSLAGASPNRPRRGASGLRTSRAG